MIPDPWPFVLLALAAYRVWKLVAEDAILDPLRYRLYMRLHGSSPEFKRVEEFLSCPWCSGAWMSLAWWLGWYAFPTGALVAATPFALSAVVGLVGVRDEPV